MTVRTVVLTTLVTILSLFAAGALAVYTLAPRAALAMADIGPGSGKHCAMLQDHGEHLGLVARRMLDLDSAQQLAFEPVSDALNAWGDAVRPLCENHGNTALERLAAVDEFAQLTSAAVSDARSDFESFYSTLSEEQKATVEELAQHRRHGRGSRHGSRHWHR